MMRKPGNAMNINAWNLAYMAGAMIAGILIPIQTGYNAQLGRALHGPIYSTLAVFCAGLLSLAICALLTRAPIPSLSVVAQAPTVSWFAGGVIGAIYIVLLTILVPRLGAAPTVAFVVVGQLVCSTIIDHFGLLGFSEHAASPQRLAGLAMIAGGVALVRLF
jgi:transporter family-2 protein